MNLLLGSSEVPSSLRFSVRNLDTSRQEDFSRLQKAVFRDWQGAGKMLDVEVQVDPRLGVPEIDHLPDPLAAEAHELRIGTLVSLRAKSYAGIQRGVQTLKQLLENAAQCGKLPHCRILDWPRIAYRGIHLDMAREMEYRPEYLRRVVERVAYFKLNMLHLYLENKFVYRSHPEVAPPHVMTPDQAKELCQYAGQFGITVVPQIPTLGHMENILIGDLAPLRERPDDAFNLCPTHPDSRPFLGGLIADVAAAFQSPYIHLGYDESDSGVCERCRQHGSKAVVLADHLNWLNQEVKRHGARTMIYGDKLLSPDEFPRADACNGGSIEEAHLALDRVERDAIITDWHYTAPFGDTTRYLVNKGFLVYMVTATNIFWHDSIPLAQGHWWIVETLDRAIAAGATGAFNSNWEFRLGQFFENYWFFEALAAERQWSSAPHDFITYGRRFSSRLWGTETDFYSSLAALAESSTTHRTTDFLSGHVLTLHPSENAQDYVERGASLIDRVEIFRQQALRNQDTLTMLDMPGQIIRYTGTRQYQIEMLKRALARGQKAEAVDALRQIGNVSREVAARLKMGYDVYGGAVDDRKKIQAHIDQIDKAIDQLQGLEGSGLKNVTVEGLAK
jgi:hypothetical protein